MWRRSASLSAARSSTSLLQDLLVDAELLQELRAHVAAVAFR